MMTISSAQIFDKIDRAIIYLAQNDWMNKWKIQKGIFYFLWLLSMNEKIKFKEIVKKIQIEPDKQGPYSMAIDGEVENLIKDGFLDVKNPNSKILPVRATEKGKDEFLNFINSDEELFLSDIKNLLEKLNSDEVVFFIYFNPYIPDDIKFYFVSKSELKEHFAENKDKYIQKLLKSGIIDNTVANRMKNMSIK